MKNIKPLGMAKIKALDILKAIIDSGKKPTISEVQKRLKEKYKIEVGPRTIFHLLRQLEEMGLVYRVARPKPFPAPKGQPVCRE